MRIFLITLFKLKNTDAAAYLTDAMTWLGNQYVHSELSWGKANKTFQASNGLHILDVK